MAEDSSIGGTTRTERVLDTPQSLNGHSIPWWQPVVLAAMAGGMGWGIRGQYGHESGAMIAGLLVSLVLVFLFCPNAASLPAARAVAWCTVAIGFGGSMTYGQTVGLTHDGPLIGNWDALRWGLFGLAVKGGIWIGFAGVFLGIGLGGVRYRALELLALMAVLVGLFFLGVQLLNRPFDPSQKILPWLYFSDHWRWEPDSELKPRPECWGGLFFALAGAIVHTGWIRKDGLARRLAFWGILGGAIGFPLGQSVQAFHAWNVDFFREGFLRNLEPHMNWWNMMETTFGAVFGAILALGLWLNRSRISVGSSQEHSTLSRTFETILIIAYASLLICGEFLSVRPIERFTDLGLSMGILPVVAIAAGRWWPYLVALPLTALPIAGKTLRQLAYREQEIAIVPGWMLYIAVPMIITTAAAVWFIVRSGSGERAGVMTGRTLLLVTWLYFGLNYAFFHFPWPWSQWTGRTPNGIIFSVCVTGITIAVLTIKRRRSAEKERT